MIMFISCLTVLCFSWTMKLPLISTSEESAWLNHELGRCRMELEDYDEAVKLGEKSFEAATECVDHMWQLNASMLTAQAQCKEKTTPFQHPEMRTFLYTVELLCSNILISGME